MNKNIFKTLALLKCPMTKEWIKLWYIDTADYYSATEKKVIAPSAATWTDLESILLSEVSQRRENIL